MSFLCMFIIDITASCPKEKRKRKENTGVDRDSLGFLIHLEGLGADGSHASRMANAMTCTFVLVLFIGYSTGYSQGNIYQRLPVYQNLFPNASESRLETSRQRHLASCCGRCTQLKKCRSIYYSEDAKECLIFDTTASFIEGVHRDHVGHTFDYYQEHVDRNCPKYVGYDPSANGTISITRTILLLEVPFPCCGKIAAVEFNAIDNGTVLVDIFRRENECESYQLVHTISITVKYTGTQWRQLAEKSDVRQGDVMAVRPSSSGKHVIAHTPMSGQSRGSNLACDSGPSTANVGQRKLDVRSCTKTSSTFSIRAVIDTGKTFSRF